MTRKMTRKMTVRNNINESDSYGYSGYHIKKSL